MNNKKILKQINDLSLKDITKNTFHEININKNNEILLIMNCDKYYKFIEGIGLFNDNLMIIEVEKHMGMFKDSLILKDYSNELYDLRYFQQFDLIDFYNIDINTKKLYIKNIGIRSLKVLVPKGYTDDIYMICETNRIVEIIFNENEGIVNEFINIWK